MICIWGWFASPRALIAFSKSINFIDFTQSQVLDTQVFSSYLLQMFSSFSTLYMITKIVFSEMKFSGIYETEIVRKIVRYLHVIKLRLYKL